MANPTSKAIRQCAEWLHWCIENGWSKSLLDDLEHLWWEYHDEFGNFTCKQPS